VNNPPAGLRVGHDDNVEHEKDYVLRTVEERHVRFVQLWFTDVLGVPKSIQITPAELEVALEEGLTFDGSSVDGFSRVQESDVLALPDATTFQLLPYLADGTPTARVVCDIVNLDGTPFEGDPRQVLRRALDRAHDLGFAFYAAPELEYFYFSRPGVPDGAATPVPLDHGSEIDLRYTDALSMADTIMTARLVVKELAARRDVMASFMPKPLAGVQGSGMHLHVSLFSEGTNAFYRADDPYHLSPIARRFIAGLLRHAREITAVTNQWVNSYKRLIVGYEAPVYISWARNNRSALVRVPPTKAGKPDSTRVEYRAADPACNPYLALAAVLTAGLAGVEGDYELPAELATNLYDLSSDQRRSLGIEALPSSLADAVDELEASKLAADTLGEHVFEWFVRNKRAEWVAYRSEVTPFELRRYLPTL
jgi:glutamine synthetase